MSAPTHRQVTFLEVSANESGQRLDNYLLRNAQNVPGLAASKGCQEKWDKYESQDVIPIAYEPYGRIAIESLRRLEEISINAASTPSIEVPLIKPIASNRLTPPFVVALFLLC